MCRLTNKVAVFLGQNPRPSPSLFRPFKLQCCLQRQWAKTEMGPGKSVTTVFGNLVLQFLPCWLPAREP